MATQCGLYAAIAAASMGAIAYDRLKSQLELKQIHHSIELACREYITERTAGIQTSLDASVSALDRHCRDNHSAAGAALRGENNEMLSELQDLLIGHLNDSDQRGAIAALLRQFSDDMQRQAAESRNEASHVSDLALQRVKVLEERLASMQQAQEALEGGLNELKGLPRSMKKSTAPVTDDAAALADRLSGLSLGGVPKAAAI